MTSLGGGVVATLPLLAAFLDEPFEPSPYAPASRLFWNELYLDPRVLPEFEESGAAQRLVESAEFRREIEALREGSLVDYRELMITKRRVFEEMAHRFFSRPSRRREDFERFLAGHPEVEAYAAFRAVGGPAGGRLAELARAPARGHPRRRRFSTRQGTAVYHLWAQWGDRRADALPGHRGAPPGAGALPRPAAGRRGGLLRRLARARDLRPGRLGRGAARLALHQGAELGLPAALPGAAARTRLPLPHLLPAPPPGARGHPAHRPRHAAPPALLDSAGDGGGRRGLRALSAEELYAILSLESQRHEAFIVGENLGTVPPEVSEGMERHGILGMYVVQYELQPGSEGNLRQPPAASVASLNTHDMPTFRSSGRAGDVETLQDLGFFSAEEATHEKGRRQALRQGLSALLPPSSAPRDEAETYQAVLHDRLAWLARSQARMVLINLEDLWQEAEPQNVPGTHLERPNWQRKAKARLRGVLGPAGCRRAAARCQRPARGEETACLRKKREKRGKRRLERRRPSDAGSGGSAAGRTRRQKLRKHSQHRSRQYHRSPPLSTSSPRRISTSSTRAPTTRPSRSSAPTRCRRRRCRHPLRGLGAGRGRGLGHRRLE